MINILDIIYNWLTNFGYIGVAIASLGVFPVEILITVFTKDNYDNILIISIYSGIGSTVGALITYTLGFLFEEDKVYKWITNSKLIRVSKEDIERSKNSIHKRSVIYTFLSRFVPWLKIAVGIAAGIIKMNIFSFTISTFIGSFLYSAIIGYISFELGTNWEILSRYFQAINYLILGLVIVYIGYKLLTKKK